MSIIDNAAVTTAKLQGNIGALQQMASKGSLAAVSALKEMLDNQQYATAMARQTDLDTNPQVAPVMQQLGARLRQPTSGIAAGYAEGGEVDSEEFPAGGGGAGVIPDALSPAQLEEFRKTPMIPGQSASGSELDRNISNTLSALPGASATKALGAVGTGARALAGWLGGLLNKTAPADTPPEETLDTRGGQKAGGRSAVRAGLPAAAQVRAATSGGGGRPAAPGIAGAAGEDTGDGPDDADEHINELTDLQAEKQGLQQRKKDLYAQQRDHAIQNATPKESPFMQLVAQWAAHPSGRAITTFGQGALAQMAAEKQQQKETNAAMDAYGIKVLSVDEQGNADKVAFADKTYNLRKNADVADLAQELNEAKLDDIKAQAEERRAKAGKLSRVGGAGGTKAPTASQQAAAIARARAEIEKSPDSMNMTPDQKEAKARQIAMGRLGVVTSGAATNQAQSMAGWGQAMRVD